MINRIDASSQAQLSSTSGVESSTKPTPPSVETAKGEQAAKPSAQVQVGRDFADSLLSKLKFGGGLLFTAGGVTGAILTSPLILVGSGIGFGVGKLLQKAGISKGVDYGVAAGGMIGSGGTLAIIALGLHLILSSSKEEAPAQQAKEIKKEKPVNIGKLKDEDIKKLTPDQIKKLPETEIKKIDNWQLHLFSSEQLHSVDVTKLDSKQLNVFLAGDGLPMLSKDQINNLLNTQQGRVIDGKLVFHPLNSKIEANNLFELEEATKRF